MRKKHRLKSYQISLNLNQNLLNLYQILMNLYQSLMNPYQILMNLYQFLTNYVISKKKRKKNGYFIEIISNYRHNTMHHPWLETHREMYMYCTVEHGRVLSCWRGLIVVEVLMWTVYYPCVPVRFRDSARNGDRHHWNKHTTVDII